MDVVDILDSDEEQTASEVASENSSTSNAGPASINTISSADSNKTVPAVIKNRPGPLSMKIKLGVPIEKDNTPETEQNKPGSPAADSNDSDFRKQNKILSNLVDPCSKFLADFDPEHSVRERRKMTRKVGPQAVSYAKPGALYDENGIHRESGLDACDCLDITCPGCHFACPNCDSNKCGQVCRVHRKFIYDSLLFDGKDTEIKNRLASRR